MFSALPSPKVAEVPHSLRRLQLLNVTRPRVCALGPESGEGSEGPEVLRQGLPGGGAETQPTGSAAWHREMPGRAV